ncbi:hypothetical protein LQ948_11155 [Jiella sp. MQZ9-1]|nr:hypothetical protein [Jiella flava]
MLQNNDREHNGDSSSSHSAVEHGVRLRGANSGEGNVPRRLNDIGTAIIAEEAD